MNFKKDSANFIVLAVLDGWGIAPAGPGNAISLANTVNINRLWVSCPHTQLAASGEAVGLPRGEDGNTETGHINLGAGRIVYQDLARINMAIADGSFFDNEILNAALNHTLSNNSNLHLMGLVGAGGVHSNIEHLFALIQLAKKKNIKRVFLHLFTDGRDSPPTSAKTYIEKVEEVIKKEGVGKIASLMGRYWAMDRDRRWDRTQRAYFALTRGEGKYERSPYEALENSYNQGITDEFIEPTLLVDEKGFPLATISDNDAVIFFNFRIDRPRQLTSAFVVSDFREGNVALEFDPFLERYEKTHLSQKVASYQKLFNRGKALTNLFFVMMTQYSSGLVASGAKPAFPPEKVDMPLGKVISINKLLQLRMAESEKERFVTYYFNGQNEEIFPGEDRLITPSPNVPTYDQKPEMSAREQTEKLLQKLQEKKYSFILINYANPDMVGHTGNIGPTVKACEVVDECIGKIVNFVLAYDGVLFITADHGNAEEMINPESGAIDTEHSKNPVPFIVVSKKYLGKHDMLSTGILADVAPTILSLLKIEIPSSMTGRNLLAELETYRK